MDVHAIRRKREEITEDGKKREIKKTILRLLEKRASENHHGTEWKE